MLRYLAAAKLLKRYFTNRVDNAMFFLHYRVSFALFMTCSALITAKEYFGGPITCFNIKNPIPQNVLNTYCFFMSTYSITQYNDTGNTVVYPGVGPEVKGADVVHRSYYQWVPLVLFLQAISFYIPRWVWKSFDGGLFSSILQGMNKFSLDQGSKDKKYLILLKYMKTHFNMHRNWAIRFFVCELVCLVVVVSNIYATDSFLGGTFLTYGSDVLGLPDAAQDSRTDPMHYIFPKVTKCMFRKFGATGSLESHDSMCVLPINILNEKVYVGLWLWMVGLSCFTGLWLLLRICVVIFKPFRTYLLNLRGRLAGREAVEYVAEHSPLGDWFLLYHLGACMWPQDFGAFLREYHKALKSREAAAVAHYPSAPSPDSGVVN